MAKMEDDELRLLLLRIADKSDETQLAVASLDKKVDLHIQATEFKLEKIRELDQVQNQQLAEHIEGVNTLKKMYEAHDKADADRFQKLEAPRQWFSQTAKVVLAIGALAGAIAALAELLGLFK